MLSEPQVTLPAPNPWRTVWFSPRRTIREIVAAEERPNWIPVVVLTALVAGARALQVEPAEGTISGSRSMMPLIISMAQVVFGVLVGPFLLAFVGGWLGGEADPDELRHVVVWSQLPNIAAAAITLPVMLMMFGARALAPATLTADGLSMWPALAVIVLALVEIGAVCWGFVLHTGMLAEVQRFSVWRALLSIIILLIPLLLMGALA